MPSDDWRSMSTASSIALAIYALALRALPTFPR